MNANTTTANIAADLEKGEEVVVTFADGSTLEGEFVSINSKGLNVRVEDRLVTRSLAKIESVARPADEDDTEADELEGMTTAELADMFETTARALRVRLRKLGLGVGKGSRYHLTDAELAIVRSSVEGEPIEA